jgi:acyl dehydratase
VSPAAAGPRFYFEDVVLHDVQNTPAMTVTQAHVSLFRGLVGQAPEDVGAVPDLLMICLTTGLGWRIAQPPLAVIAFLSLEWHVTRPLAVGDTVFSRAKTVIKRSMKDGGIVVEERDLIDQHGEVVHRGRFTFLVERRPTERS